jgi:hypothetical protein
LNDTADDIVDAANGYDERAQNNEAVIGEPNRDGLALRNVEGVRHRIERNDDWSVQRRERS